MIQLSKFIFLIFLLELACNAEKKQSKQKAISEDIIDSVAVNLAKKLKSSLYLDFDVFKMQGSKLIDEKIIHFPFYEVIQYKDSLILNYYYRVNRLTNYDRFKKYQVVFNRNDYRLSECIDEPYNIETNIFIKKDGFYTQIYKLHGSPNGEEPQETSYKLYTQKGIISYIYRYAYGKCEVSRFEYYTPSAYFTLSHKELENDFFCEEDLNKIKKVDFGKIAFNPNHWGKMIKVKLNSSHSIIELKRFKKMIGNKQKFDIETINVIKKDTFSFWEDMFNTRYD